MKKTIKELNIDEIIELLKYEGERLKTNEFFVEGALDSLFTKMPIGTKYVEYFKTKRFRQLRDMVFKSKYVDNVDNLIKLAKAEIPGIKFSEIENVVLRSKNPYWCVKFLKEFPDIPREKYEKILLNSKSGVWCAEYLTTLGSKNPKNLLDFIIKDGDREALTRIFQRFSQVGKELVGKKYIDTFFSDEYRYTPIYCYPKVDFNQLKEKINELVDNIIDKEVDKTMKESLIHSLYDYAEKKVKEYEFNKLTKNYKLKYKAM